MENTYTYIFLLVSIGTIFFLKKDLITSSNLGNKFFILCILTIINTLLLVYKHYKKSKPINAVEIIKKAIFYSFVGTFAYVVFSDMCQIDTFGISKNINLQAIFYSIFIGSFIAIFNGKLE